MAVIRPSFIDNMSWEMAEVYGAITDQILINLAKYFPYWKTSNVPKSAFEYQATMLAQMGQVNRETINIIRNGLKGANSALTNCLEQAIIEAVKKSEPDLLKAVKQGILKPAGIPVVSPNQTRAFSLYYQQAAQKLNLVNTVMLESTKQAYQATVSDIVNRVQATQTALDIGAGEVVTGVSSWNQAVRHSIERMKQNGITGFIDHGNHKWSAEAYTAMDIRTTMANTARAAVWETNQDFGNDLYLVSYHNGARPGCYDWQNKVVSANDRSGVTYDLDGNEIPFIPQSSTSYGDPAGLFGINCKHYPIPFIPGVSLIRGEPQSPEENKKTYEESQQQRALEREIREQKRDLLMMKAQGATDEEIKAQRAKIRATDDKIDKFCDETGRTRRQDREGVYTKRSFPDKDTYDVSTFERTQKEQIDKYFNNGGAQQGYTFGELTPKEPITQTMPPTVPAPEVAPNNEVATFTPAKTQAEAEAYAKEHFAKFVNYDGVPVEKCNAINQTLEELQRDYPTNKMTFIKKGNYRGGSTMWANGDELIHTGKRIDENMGIDWVAQKKEYEEQAKVLKWQYEGRMTASITRTIKEYEELAKFERYSYGTNSVHDIVVHEYGHILADQRIGQINGRRYCKNKYSSECIKLQDLVKQTRKEVIKTGEIYGMSAYAKKNDFEFFAESFAGYRLGYKLPQTVITMLERVLSFGQV